MTERTVGARRRSRTWGAIGLHHRGFRDRRRARETNVALRPGPADGEAAARTPPKEHDMISLRTLTAAAALTVAAAALAGTPAASAKGGDGVKVRGACTQGSSAKLKLGREDSGTEIEFEVDQNRNAVPWKVTLLRGGSQIAAATIRTRAPSGSFEYRKISSGGGTFTAVATRSGEHCSASATI
jgi:hypothetical protein